MLQRRQKQFAVGLGVWMGRGLVGVCRGEYSNCQVG